MGNDRSSNGVPNGHTERTSLGVRLHGEVDHRGDTTSSFNLAEVKCVYDKLGAFLGKARANYTKTTDCL